MDFNWFIVKIRSGKEFEAKMALELRIKDDSYEKIEEIIIPTYKETIYKNGKKKKLERKSYPGYICIKMEMNYESKNYVCSTPYISGFLSNKDVLPIPMLAKEINIIKSKIEENVSENQKMEMGFELGEKVLIVDGPFNNFIGVVKYVYPDKGKISVDIEIFGRKTPVEIDYYKVKKH
jgi:transcriptional antiterminator NusG